jgi:ribonuclease-3 family protein
MELSDITTPALAYLGDSVLEVCVRTYLVTERGLSTSAHLNAASLDFVRASAQSEAMGRIEPMLTEQETGYYGRGRNMGHGNVPKSASVAEYRRATGMEVLFGYLSITGQTQRMNHLFRVGYGLTRPDAGQQDQSGEQTT